MGIESKGQNQLEMKESSRNGLRKIPKHITVQMLEGGISVAIVMHGEACRIREFLNMVIYVVCLLPEKPKNFGALQGILDILLYLESEGTLSPRTIAENIIAIRDSEPNNKFDIIKNAVAGLNNMVDATDLEEITEEDREKIPEIIEAIQELINNVTKLNNYTDQRYVNLQRQIKLNEIVNLQHLNSLLKIAETLGDLANYTESDILRKRGFGRAKLRIIKKLLEDHGLSLKK